MMSPTIKYNCGCNYWRYWIIGALGQCPHHLKWLLIYWLFSCQQLHCETLWDEGIKEQPSVFHGGTALSRGYVTLWYDTAQQRMSEPGFKETSVRALSTYSSHALRPALISQREPGFRSPSLNFYLLVRMYMQVIFKLYNYFFIYYKIINLIL